VIHGGIYYPAGSRKAQSRVEGRERLYAYCVERGVPHHRLGKLIVAADEAEIPGLEAIVGAAHANGVDNLEWLTGATARRLEPALSCVAALLSPATGIIDSHALMLAYQGDAEAAGAMVVLRTPVLSGRVRNGGFDLVTGGDEPTTLHCHALVNAAGLHAPALARRVEGVPIETIPRAYFCRGVYFTLSGRAPFRHLVYPVPVAGGLGVHLTLDLAGQARFGPDVEWIPQSSLLCRDPQLLARSGRRRLAARLRRHPAEDQRTRRTGGRFSGPGARNSWRARSRQSLRHRVTRIDGVLAARGRGAGLLGALAGASGVWRC
jgi:L-2-hydroxyglutarate oxidase LhgO